MNQNTVHPNRAYQINPAAYGLMTVRDPQADCPPALSDRFETEHRKASALVDLLCACRTDELDPQTIGTIAAMLAESLRICGQACKQLIEQVSEGMR